MRSKTFEVPGVLALIFLLAASYGLGYWIGIRLTGLLVIALPLAFILPCLTMIGVVLIAVATGNRRDSHARIQ